MSGVAGSTTGGGGSNAFNPRVILAVIAAGVIGFLGYLILSAFAPELDEGNNGQGHALSRSAIGYAGVVRVLRATGMQVEIVRDPKFGLLANRKEDDTPGLLVLTPDRKATYADIQKRLEGVDVPVLIVLPKHEPWPDPDHRGWVREGSLTYNPERMLVSTGDNLPAIMPLPAPPPKVAPAPAPAPPQANAASPVERDAPSVEPQAVPVPPPPVLMPQPQSAAADKGEIFSKRVRPARPTINAEPWPEYSFTLPLPPLLQTVRGAEIEPLIWQGDDIILGILPGRADTYVLSDPDLINNLAMADPKRALAAVRLLEAVAERGAPIGFDVVMNGLGADRLSVLRLAFTPPFLGLTLCLIIAGLLTLWQSFVRFGPPLVDRGANALGKAGLVSNAAQLIVLARRVPGFSSRYGAMIRDNAAQRLHAPTRLTGADLDRWLDRFTDRRGQKFTQLLAQLDAAKTNDDCVRSAAALGQWRKDILRESD